MYMDKEVKDSPYYNRVAGADANLRFGQYTTVTGFIAKSSVPGIDSDNMEGKAYFQYSDRKWSNQVSYQVIQNNFTNDMGYTPRKGVRRYNGRIWRSFRPDNSSIRQIYPHLVVDYYSDTAGNFDSKYVDYHFPVTWQNGAQIELGMNSTVEALKKPFSLNNGKNLVPVGTYDMPEYFFFFRPDASKRYGPAFRIGLGSFYTGYKHNYTFNQSLRINHHFNAALNFTHNNISLAEGHYKTNLISTRVNYSFSTAVFLNALVQYNSDARTWSSNIRFNIIHRPLSDFFLVYNERRNSLTGDLQDRSLIGKVTYMIQR